MEKYLQDIEQLVELIKKNDDKFKTKGNELLNKLNQENKTREVQYSIILLNFILNNFTLRNLQYDNLQKEEVEKFKKLIQITSSTPYPNISTHILCLKNKKREIDLLVDGLISIYKEYQIEYINKFYSKITLANLQSILGKEIVNEEFIKSRNWKLNKNVVEIENKPSQNIDAETAMRTVQFLGKMNTELSKIIKGNLLIDLKI
jgi:hypothetical protein